MNHPPSHIGPLLRSRQRVFGAWTSIGHASITEMFTDAGVDFVGIDLEHSTISQEQAQRIIAAAQAGGAACLPRVASHNGEQIRRLLDSGADGIIVPNVTTVEEVQQLIAWSKYPPVGRRGYGVSRAQGYGMAFERYTAEWNTRSAVILQIESIESVKVVDQLLRADGVDGVMVGPYDMSGSLGIPGRLTDRRVTDACARVVEACRKHGKACGTQLIEPTQEGVESAFTQGYTFVVLASDVFILWKWTERMHALTDAQRRSARPRGSRRVRARE